MKKFTLFFAMAIIASTGFSQTTLFEENFDDGNADVRLDTVSAGEAQATMDYDYINAGMTAAPNGGGLGMKMEANITIGSSSRIFAFIDQQFTGTYTLEYDLWLETDTASGNSGTTEFSLTAVQLLDKTVPTETGNLYAFTNENGSSSDVRVHEDGVLFAVDEVDGAYLIDPSTGTQTKNNNYDDPEQSGVYAYAYDGMMAMKQWLRMKVEVTPDSLIWSCNDFRWSAMANILDQEGYVAIGYADWFSSVANFDVFGLVDNIIVYDPTVGIFNHGIQEMEVKLYPNPANGAFNIEVAQRANLSVLNSVGQVVYRDVVEQGVNPVDLSGMSTGIYYARLKAEDGSMATKKLILK